MNEQTLETIKTQAESIKNHKESETPIPVDDSKAKDNYPFPIRESLLQRIWHFIFGYRYYAILTSYKGNFRCGFHENLLWTRRDAEVLLDAIRASYDKVEIVPFRSRNKYQQRVDKNDVTYYELY